MRSIWLAPPGVMRCWSRRGHQRNIETPRQNKKHYGAGLIHWVSGKLSWAKSSHKNNALFRAALDQLIEPDGSEVVRKKYVVVDTYRIHFAKPVLAELSAHQDEIELVCLPTYSRQHQSCPAVLETLASGGSLITIFSRAMERLMDAVSSFFVTWLLLLISFAAWRG